MSQNFKSLDLIVLRREWVNEQVSARFDEDDVYSSSAFRGALDAITRAAIDHEYATGARPENITADQIHDVVFDGAAVVFELSSAIQWPDKEEFGTGGLWRHRDSPLDDVKSKRAPRLNRFTIEEAVQQYLELPYRSQPIDRLLVDLLVALELYAFGEEAMHGLRYAGSATLKQRPILYWFMDKVLLVILWVLAALALWGLSAIGLFPEDWLWGANGIIALVFILYFAWSTLLLPSHWWRVMKQKKHTRELLVTMMGAYSELASESVISARHTQHRARTAADAGVVWPSLLFVLLDDIVARDGKF